MGIEEEKQKMLKMVKGMQCPSNFKCCNNGCQRLCQTKDIGKGDFVECLEKDPKGCKFAISFEDKYYCTCPLQVYITHKLQEAQKERGGSPNAEGEPQKE